MGDKDHGLMMMSVDVQQFSSKGNDKMVFGLVSWNSIERKKENIFTDPNTTNTFTECNILPLYGRRPVIYTSWRTTIVLRN